MHIKHSTLQIAYNVWIVVKSASNFTSATDDLAFQMNAHNMHRLHISRAMYLHKLRAYVQYRMDIGVCVAVNALIRYIYCVLYLHANKYLFHPFNMFFNVF